ELFQMFTHKFVVLALVGAIAAEVVPRSKRQSLGYYLCGGTSNGCGTSYSGCGSNCGGSSSIILPSTFYSSPSNCQTPCSNINCNQYANGQYVARIIGSGQYSPCASSCCGGGVSNWPSVIYSGYNNNGYYNPYAANVIGNGVYNTNPLTQVGPGPVVISSSVRRSPVPAAFTGTISNGVLMCGGNEPAGGSCAGSGTCPSGHLCVAGNVCCRCAVGASAGTCPSGRDSECPVGYGCAASSNCCPTEVKQGQGLAVCVNGGCNDGFECGKGNLCYPSG
ncbi:hypothetical protein V3C99_016686, partial [Haemonchus contortus]